MPKKKGHSIYFETKNNEGRVYLERIEVSGGEVLIYNCTCPFSSVYRFSKKFIERGTKCRHIKEAISLLKFLGYLKK